MSPSTAVSSNLDFTSAANVFRNLSSEELQRHAVERDNCVLAKNGAVVAYSGKYTGRSPKDKHSAREPGCERGPVTVQKSRQGAGIEPIYLGPSGFIHNSQLEDYEWQIDVWPKVEFTFKGVDAYGLTGFLGTTLVIDASSDELIASPYRCVRRYVPNGEFP